ncbi:MAG: hypothetical protein ABR543_07000 [Gemmatimonadaceae bacterium]
MAAAACDKTKEFINSGQAAVPPQLDPADALDLSARPVILFQVFGEAEDPRLIPVAAVIGKKLRQINLTQEGWRKFDAMYLGRDSVYALFSDGRAQGTVRVKRGMWEDPDDPLYSLPGCVTLTPVAAVQMSTTMKTEFTVEFLAASDQLGEERAGAQRLAGAEVAATARRLAYEAATGAGITRRMLDSLDFRAVAIRTGAGTQPTIVASFVDPASENPGPESARTIHLLLIADTDSAGTYTVTYLHRVNGPLSSAAFRRYFDHLNVSGDATDEIVLEGWRVGGDTYLSVLSFRDGQWEESFRSRPNWCLDERKN